MRPSTAPPSGSSTTWRPEFLGQRWHAAQPRLLGRAAPAERLPFDALFAAAQRALPGWTINDWQARTEIRKLRIDPYTGELRGTPATYPQTLEGWRLILHTELFAGTAGAAAVGIFGVGLLPLGVSGGWLYRGFWKNFFTLRWECSARIFFSDLHKTIGITSVAFNLMVGFTGVWWTCERVNGALSRSNEAQEATPAAVPPPFDPARAKVSLDALLAEAGRASG